MDASRRHPGHRLPGHPLARAALAAATIAAASVVYQAAADARDRSRFRAPGRLVNIGGRRVHLMEAGEGSPAVVIVSALGDGVLGWIPVWRVLAQRTRACVYDRAGIGWSDPPGIGKRTFDHMADELHHALTAARIPPPYLVAGHSLGGIIARRLAVRYPGEVAGIVLVDSSHEDQARHLGSYWRRRARQQLLRRAVWPLGLRRLAAFADPKRGLDAELAREVPAEYIAAARAFTFSSRQRRAAVRELLLMTRSHARPPDLGSLPVTVVTAAGKDPRWDQVWTRMQADLAAISTQIRRVTANTGHYIHLDDPALVIKVISDLLAMIS